MPDQDVYAVRGNIVTVTDTSGNTRAFWSATPWVYLTYGPYRPLLTPLW